MTFDEALQIYDDPEVEDLIEVWEVVDVIERLRDKYEPNATVEMTRTQFARFMEARKSSHNRPDNVGFLEFMTLYAAFENVKHTDLMRAWINPGVIKVVDQ